MSVGDAVRRPDRDVWTQPDAGRSAGTLVVAWQHPERRLIEPVGLLQHGPGLGYRFCYLRRAADVEGFRPFLGFPDLRRTYDSDTLFPLFSQRIMSDRRPDYSRFLEQLHLDSSASPWEQLARSEGRRTGDTVQVFPVPTINADGTSSCRFLVHGVRHVSGEYLPPLGEGETLALVDEPDNPVNSDAVLVCSLRGERLGYVPNLLLEHLRALEEAGPVRAAIEHVNGPDVPVHLRILARLDGVAPENYLPMSGPNWATFEDGNRLEVTDATSHTPTT